MVNDVDDITRAKAALRARFRAFRQRLTTEQYTRRSVEIVNRLRELPELRAARTVHTYWPLVREHEVDIRPLVDELYHAGKQIVLPAVTAFTRARNEEPRMRHLRYEGTGSLRPNRWGLHEPSSSESVPIETLDVVIVPALGAGENGHRIGHGFGYYDEFLRTVRVPTICPVYAECLIDAVPAEPHDVPVTVIVTERAVVRVGRPLGPPGSVLQPGGRT